MPDDKDRSGKWILQHHGVSLVRLARVGTVRAWRPLQADVVQPRQLPDGLLEVEFEGHATADLFLLEIATYPKRDIEEQLLRDLLLVTLDRRALPEVLLIVLQPRGVYRVPDLHEMHSRLGLTRLTAGWHVIEVWTLKAEDLLAVNEIGLIPWVPLTQFDGPPEVLIQQCRERIDEQASPDERANLLAVTQVMTRLRYNDEQLLALLGGNKVMIESPLIDEWLAKAKQSAKQEAIVELLEYRFGALSSALGAEIRTVSETAKLSRLHLFAHECPDLEAFRAALRA